MGTLEQTHLRYLAQEARSDRHGHSCEGRRGGFPADAFGVWPCHLVRLCIKWLAHCYHILHITCLGAMEHCGTFKVNWRKAEVETCKRASPRVLLILGPSVGIDLLSRGRHPNTVSLGESRRSNI